MRVSMDDDLQAKILAFVTEPKASVSCQTWKNYLYESCKLAHRISFNQLLAQGPVTFSYNALRPLGEDFEESVTYDFTFAPDGTYKMQWTRTFDAWSSQSEQHVGGWRIFNDQIECETLEPNREVGEREVRIAPAGYKFSVAIDDILIAEGKYFQEITGAPAKAWEITARTGKLEESSKTGVWQPVEGYVATQPREAVAPRDGYVPRANADARFVEIDGDFHEVSGDIVANWPEEDWARLMKCRMRFGING